MCSVLAEAATLNDPATGDFCVQISRQMRSGSFAPNFGHDGALAAITKADTVLEKAHDRKWVVSG